MAAPEGAPGMAAPEPLMCRAVFSASLVALVFGYVWSVPGAAPGDASAWLLPGPSQSCGSWNMTPGDSLQSPGVVPSTSLMQCWFLAVAQAVFKVC